MSRSEASAQYGRKRNSKRSPRVAKPDVSREEKRFSFWRRHSSRSRIEQSDHRGILEEKCNISVLGRADLGDDGNRLSFKTL